MENNNLVAGAEMMLKALESMKPKDMNAAQEKEVDEAIKKGSDQLTILKKAMEKAKEDINL